MLLCLHVEQRALGSEEGGSHLMQNTEYICMLCFVCSQLGSEQLNTSQLGSDVMFAWGIRCFTKVGFKINFLSFDYTF